MARLFDQTSGVCFDVEVSPKMPRTRSKAVSECKGLVLHDKSGSGESTMTEIHRVLKQGFDIRMDKYFDRMNNRF